MVHCPNCEKKIDDCDWFYTRDLYNGDTGPQKENCPHCDTEFMIEAYETIEYKTCTVERFEEFEEIL